MSTARKKVVVRYLDQNVQRGYLPAGGLGASDQLDLLLPDGRVFELRISDLKYVAYVRDFNLDDRSDPERLGLRKFSSKPRGGLWVRVQFADDDTLEGLLHGGLPLLDALISDRGLFLEPPARNGNTQRLFIPRSSLTGFDILGVAGSASVGRRRPVSGPQRQGALFGPTDED